MFALNMLANKNLVGPLWRGRLKRFFLPTSSTSKHPLIQSRYQTTLFSILIAMDSSERPPPSSSHLPPHVRRHVPIPYKLTGLGKRQAKLQSMPFLSDEVMGSKPLSCSHADLTTPKLRKCPFDLTRIDWSKSERLGGGLDGYVWRIWLDDRSYAMKIFWDTEPITDGPYYYAAQRECQNSALLQHMEAAIHEAKVTPDSPILIDPNPKTKEDALDNTFGFSQEGRQNGFSGLDVDYEPVAVSSMPRMRQCHGWAKINSSMIRRDKQAPMIKVDKTQRYMELDKEHIAIIYEYVDEGKNDPDVAVEVGNFLYRAGFKNDGSLGQNWKGSVLLDLSDFVHATGYGWSKTYYRPWKATELLYPL